QQPSDQAFLASARDDTPSHWTSLCQSLSCPYALADGHAPLQPYVCARTRAYRAVEFSLDKPHSMPRKDLRRSLYHPILLHSSLAQVLALLQLVHYMYRHKHDRRYVDRQGKRSGKHHSEYSSAALGTPDHPAARIAHYQE